jgi:hypothetical protein
MRGVVGYRPAHEGPLFLERYLDAPIERVLSMRSGLRVRRSRIVEVGNMACRNAAVARGLISVLPRYLIDRGALWITFTATRMVRELVCESGARPFDLAPAQPDRVIGAVDEWGRYYENDPRVLAGYLPAARGYPALWKAIDED